MGEWSKWRRALRATVIVATAVPAFVIVATTVTRSETTHASAPRPAIPTPDMRVFMVSDSVGLGAKSAMMSAFPPGWQVTVAGKPALFVEQMVTSYVIPQPASVFGDAAIVAGGYNYPYWDPPRFDRSIDLMVDALKSKGVERVFWITMREVKPQFYPSWNSLSAAYKTLYLAYQTANNQLRAAQLRHPELSLIDWAAVSDQVGLTYDAIHLNTPGAARYSAISSSAIRLGATRRPAGNVTEVPVAGINGVAADATAVALNLTVVNPRMQGFLTAYPCGGAVPTASNVNFRANQIIAGSAIVPIGADGKVCVYQSTEAHVIVDLNGAFGATSGFVPLTPGRAVDTRTTALVAPSTTLTVHLGDIPGALDGQFIGVINLTVLGATANGEVRLYPCDEPVPGWPTRTVVAGRISTLAMVVESDSAGDVCVTLTTRAHVLVDLFGSFPVDADIHPIPSFRVTDTRFSGIVGGGGSVTQQVAGTQGAPTDPLPSGGIVTVTLVDPQNIGFATAYPCSAGVPNVSIVNVVPNQAQSNASLVPLDASGRLCVFVSVTSHVLIDLNGWSGAAFTPLTPVRLVDTRIA